MSAYMNADGSNVFGIKQGSVVQITDADYHSSETGRTPTGQSLRNVITVDEINGAETPQWASYLFLTDKDGFTVFVGEKFNGEVEVDGTNYQVTDGEVTKS